MSRSETGPYHHGDLKHSLLDAARRLLEQDGPEAISFRAIARSAGVSQTAPYHHFKGKQDLLATLAETGFRELAQAQAAASGTSQKGRTRVVELGLEYVRFAIASPQLYRLMFGVGISDWHAYPKVEAVKRSSFEPIHAALAAQLAINVATHGDDLRTAALGAWALVHGLSMLTIDGSIPAAADDGGQPPSVVAHILKQYADGLGSPAGGG